jgi:glycosyltransferase involved in cell wall biosynthesis
LPRDPAILAGYQRVFSTARAIIAVSRDMVERLVALGAPPDRMVHNACGAALSDLPASPAAAPPRFVAVGRLTAKKAPFVTLLAFAAVRELVLDATLEIVGDGPLRGTCDQLLKALRLEGSVTLHGVTRHDDVFALLRSARCFVQHSVTAPDGDSEGTPVAVLEAMAMGLPVVSTRHGGIRDVVEEGRTGLLVDEYDVKGMTDGMLAFARDAVFAEAVGSAARAAVAGRWSTERSLARLLSVLQRAAAPADAAS